MAATNDRANGDRPLAGEVEYSKTPHGPAMSTSSAPGATTNATSICRSSISGTRDMSLCGVEKFPGRSVVLQRLTRVDGNFRAGFDDMYRTIGASAPSEGTRC